MIDRISQIGHPYHGLVEDGSLTLPNRQTIPYPGLTNGDTQLVAIPNYPVPIRIAEEQARDGANGFEWLNYVLVTDNHIGGVDLGDGWLLYIDANQVVWYLKIGFTVQNNECLMSCTLLGIFGRFGSNYPKLSKTLTQANTVLLAPGNFKSMSRFTFERKSNGSEVLIHVYANLQSANTIDLPEPMSLYEIWKLQIYGNGQLVENQNLGEGISASLTLYKSFSEIHEANNQIIIRHDNRYRLGKVNIIERYDPKPAEPPECATNMFRQTFDLSLVAVDQDFIPFSLDRNIYTQTNWFGEVRLTTAIVRMLYDKDGNVHTLRIKKENTTLNRFFQTFSGDGEGVQGPLLYLYLNNVCVPNGDPPAFVETYQGTQYVESVLKISTEVSLYLNAEFIETLSLRGESSQKATTVIGHPVVNEVNVTVKINDAIVRNVTKQPGQISNYILVDPFASVFENDHSNGVYAKFYLGFLSNNLGGLFADRLIASDIPTITIKQSHNVISSEKIDVNVKMNAEQFYLRGSFHPVAEEIKRNMNGIQGWV